MNFEKVASFGEQNDNKIEKQPQVEDLSENGQQVNLRLNLTKSLKDELKPEFDESKEAQEQTKNSLNAQKNEFSFLREEIKNSLNDQNRNQAAFEEQLKRIEAAIKSVITTTTTPVPTTTPTPVPTTTTTPAPVPIFGKNFIYIENCGNAENLPNDCSEVKKENENENGNGIFLLRPPPESQLKPFGAVCESHENKNFIIIQRRLGSDFVFFNRNWEEYKNGFGNLNGDYWLGLEQIHQMTANKNCELWMEWKYQNGITIRSAHYSEFSVADEGNGYKLKVGSFNGDLNYLKNQNGKKFSTYDKNNSGNESWNYTRDYGGGWWYDDRNNFRFYRGLNSEWFYGCYTLMAICPV